MNFLNFLTSKASLFNFNLLPQAPQNQKENTILIEPSKENCPIIPTVQRDQLSMEAKKAQEQKKLIDPRDILTQNISSLLNQEQMLINQYMELKLKYLATCLNVQAQTEMPKDANTLPQENNEKAGSKKEEISALKKKIKKQNKCGHDDKIHYAKGMCSNCYHKYGRTKKPWNCHHDKLYAAGMCQICYINSYNRKRRQEKNGQQKTENQFVNQNVEQNVSEL